LLPFYVFGSIVIGNGIYVIYRREIAIIGLFGGDTEHSEHWVSWIVGPFPCHNRIVRGRLAVLTGVGEVLVGIALVILGAVLAS